jgi:DMSO/TMAO reductase YedYZ molybdopterin-dependent catalytic subunit
MSARLFSRRALIGSLSAAGGLIATGCDKITMSPKGQNVLGVGETLTYAAQRIVSDRSALAPEYSAAEMSPVFRANGNSNPATAEYAAHAARNFADWRLTVDGMVSHPLALSLDQIRKAPHRTQITRHDCVEGWSAIGQWTGIPLGLLLRRAGLSTNARYVVFHCADFSGGRPYYESIDLVDAFHPQTILAWGMNGRPVSVAHGAPLRLRVERQLGYKQAKYVMRVEAVSSLADIYGGKGGYWEDAVGYQWYAGI